MSSTVMPGFRNRLTNEISACSNCPWLIGSPALSGRTSHQAPNGKRSGAGMRGKALVQRKYRDFFCSGHVFRKKRQTRGNNPETFGSVTCDDVGISVQPALISDI